MQKFKVNGQSVPKTEWKQTDGRTDGCECITSHANAVSNMSECSTQSESFEDLLSLPAILVVQVEQSVG